MRSIGAPSGGGVLVGGHNVATLTGDPRVRDDVDPYELALDCWAFVHGLTSLLISKPDFGWPDADAMLNGHFDRMLSGLLKC